MLKRSMIFGLCLLVFLGTCPRLPQAQGEDVPLRILEYFRSLNIPANQIPALYASMIAAMANNPEIGRTLTQVGAKGGQSLWQAAGAAGRQEVMQTLVRGMGVMEEAVLRHLNSLSRAAYGTKDAMARFTTSVGNTGNWGGSFARTYRGMSTRGGFVPLQAMLVTATAIVAFTVGYVAGKAIIKEQDLKVRAAESEAYYTTVNNLVKSINAGRTQLLPGLNQHAAITKVVRNMDAGLPPYADVLVVREPPDIAGGWKGELVVKQVSGQSAIKIGQSRSVSGKQFNIEQDANEVTLTFGGSQIRGYFGAPDYLDSHVGSQRTVTVVENAVLDQVMKGNVSRVALSYHHGAGAGSLAGALKVEMDQQSRGATITSGGLLYR